MHNTKQKQKKNRLNEEQSWTLLELCCKRKIEDMRKFIAQTRISKGHAVSEGAGDASGVFFF